MSDDGTKGFWHASLPVRTAWLLGFVVVFAGVPMLADKWVYDHVFIDKLYDQDWARFLREMGWFPTWMILGVAVWLQTREHGVIEARRRAGLLVFATGGAGILCEVLKLLLRRERPDVGAGEYVFRAWSDQTFSTAGLGLPSSHTMVAFAAATALSRLYPRARWIWYALALGCAATRVISHAHFLSDITLGALFGWCIGWGVWIAQRRTRAAKDQ